jgi:uncharacterized repeat protein (TIGR01451 family)
MGYSVALDANGNSWVTGSFFGLATFGAGEPGETTLVGLHDGVFSADMFLAGYTPNGSLLWATEAGGSAPDSGYGVAVDTAGNGSVTGSFSGSATFGAGEVNQTILTSGDMASIFLATYSGTPLAYLPDLAIGMRAYPSPARVGYNLTYTLTVDNHGTGNASKIMVHASLPRSVQLVSIPTQCRLKDEFQVRCSLPEMAAGARIQLRIVVRPKIHGALVNKAWVRATEADLNAADNQVTLQTWVRRCGYGCNR